MTKSDKSDKVAVLAKRAILTKVTIPAIRARAGHQLSAVQTAQKQQECQKVTELQRAREEP